MKKTKINRAHHLLQAKMVEFVGWEMPIQYSGVITEHIAVRTTAGIFDVSHMGEFFLRGKDALALIQRVTSNDATKLVPGKIQYSGLLTENGCFVDDLLVYMIKENEYLLVVNAANIEKDFRYIQKYSHGLQVQLVNESAEYAQIAIQGPVAEKMLQELCSVELAPIAYYHFTYGQVMGIDCLISRTGYTGEDGFEIYFIADEERSSQLFLEIARKGEKYDALPTGLGARDTLRLEAKMALYGNDIDDAHTVLEADLGWILKLNKENFLGQEALARQKTEGLHRKLVGFEVKDKGIARHGYPLYVAGHEYGTVTSGSYAPFLKKSIGLAYLPIENCQVGNEFEIGVRDKRIPAIVVETPFYKRKK